MDNVSGIERYIIWDSVNVNETYLIAFLQQQKSSNTTQDGAVPSAAQTQDRAEGNVNIRDPTFLRQGPQLQHNLQPSPQEPRHPGHTQQLLRSAAETSSPCRLCRHILLHEGWVARSQGSHPLHMGALQEPVSHTGT